MSTIDELRDLIDRFPRPPEPMIVKMKMCRYDYDKIKATIPVYIPTHPTTLPDQLCGILVEVDESCLPGAIKGYDGMNRFVKTIPL